MDPQIRWHEAESNPYMPSGEAWVGPDAVVANLFMKLGEDWAGFTVTPIAFRDAGDVVSVEGRYTAEHRGTGKSIDAQFCHVWTVQYHQVSAVHRHGQIPGRDGRSRLTRITGSGGDTSDQESRLPLRPVVARWVGVRIAAAL
jgi:ketosteroid isomerase-like protein